MMNTVSRKITAVSLSAILVCGCGGDQANSSSAHNTPGTNPGTVPLPTAQVDYSKQEAMAVLTSSALSKVNPVFLNRLLDQSASSVLAEFVVSEPLPASIEARMASYAEPKMRVAAEMGASAHVLMENYTSFPTTFIQFHSRRALVNFLNNANVKRLIDNRTYATPVPVSASKPAALFFGLERYEFNVRSNASTIEPLAFTYYAALGAPFGTEKSFLIRTQDELDAFNQMVIPLNKQLVLSELDRYNYYLIESSQCPDYHEFAGASAKDNHTIIELHRFIVQDVYCAAVAQTSYFVVRSGKS